MSCCQLHRPLQHRLIAFMFSCFGPALKVYQQKEWVLRSWRDVFVDLVQGQLQHLFLSLLSGLAPHGMAALQAVCAVTRHL